MMEILILIGLGVVIWLLLRQRGYKVVQEAPPPQTARAPDPNAGRFRYESGPKQQVLIALLRALERNPDPSPLEVADCMDSALRAGFGSSLPLEVRLNHAKFFLACYTHTTMYVFEQIETETNGLMIDRTVNAIVAALDHIGIVPVKRKKLAARAVENVLRHQVELALAEGEARFRARRERMGLLMDSMDADGSAPAP